MTLIGTLVALIMSGVANGTSVIDDCGICQQRHIYKLYYMLQYLLMILQISFLDLRKCWFIQAIHLILIGTLVVF